MAGAAVYALRFIVGWILDGIAYVIWFVDALPQALVWSALLVAVFVLSLRLRQGRPRRQSTERPAAAPTPSELARLVACIRAGERSAHARGEIERRLGQVAVALRVKRESVTPRQAWDELTEGRWPTDPDLRAALHLDRGRPGSRQGYAHQLARAVDKLWRYAEGGSLDRG
ncbi:MAG: hypothetical protein BIP78_0977 [Candidatus Bipolaricaulis sibiricus]|uniref:Uncharacterized protein n=1 Tax=Bipolaricaulis sibiricus TaxID=2501609 RepID=A0A410FUN1_BIPS1|nr:MAG: hypothetical protein BIP78_0977 [Candidatus Bipolaricaulis sibiricus]